MSFPSGERPDFPASEVLRASVCAQATLSATVAVASACVVWWVGALLDVLGLGPSGTTMQSCSEWTPIAMDL